MSTADQQQRALLNELKQEDLRQEKVANLAKHAANSVRYTVVNFPDVTASCVEVEDVDIPLLPEIARLLSDTHGFSVAIGGLNGEKNQLTIDAVHAATVVDPSEPFDPPAEDLE